MLDEINLVSKCQLLCINSIHTGYSCYIDEAFVYGGNKLAGR
jgi:hypothetical protein